MKRNNAFVEIQKIQTKNKLISTYLTFVGSSNNMYNEINVTVVIQICHTFTHLLV